MWNWKLDSFLSENVLDEEFEDKAGDDWPWKCAYAIYRVEKYNEMSMGHVVHIDEHVYLLLSPVGNDNTGPIG